MTALIAARKRPWVVVLAMVLGVVAALAALSASPTTYRSAGVLNVGSTPAAGADIFGSAGFVQQRASTYASLVRSEAFVAEVAGRVPGGPPTVTAVVEPETSLLTVTATGRTPEVAQQAATVASDLLIQRAVQLDTVAGVPTVAVTAVQVPPLPTTPVSPVPWIYVLVGLVAGLAVGVAVARLTMRSDNRVYRPSDLVDLEGQTGPVFWLPEQRWGGEASGPRHDEYARRLAAVHQEFVAMPGSRSRILLVAAPTPAHAETAHQVADDLSATLVRGGRSAVLFRLQTDEQNEHRPGLSDVLAGSHSMNDICFRDSTGRFDVGPGQQPLRLLTATEREIRSALDQLLAIANVVVVDAPALSAPVGFPVVAQVADAVLVTATPKGLRTGELVVARGVIDRLGVRSLGLLMAPRAPIPGVDDLSLAEPAARAGQPQPGWGRAAPAGSQPGDAASEVPPAGAQASARTVADHPVLQSDRNASDQ